MDKKKAVKLYLEKARRQAKENLKDFTTFTFPQFEWQPYHLVYAEILDKFAKGEIKKLIITMPPQHGKSELSTRRLPAFLLGLNPNKRIAITSYNSTIAQKFNRDVQRIIDDSEYKSLFPDTRLSSSSNSNWTRNNEEIEIVGKKGSLRAVGREGALTSVTLDVAIMDDLYKDFMEGNSPTVLESAYEWYTSVVKTRLHNDSQQLIVFTRWSDLDIIGRIEETEKVHVLNDLKELDTIPKDIWLKVNFEALKASEKTPIDQRELGEALWSQRHSKAKLKADRKLNPNKFECLYQGNPQSKEGLLYSDEWKLYKELPENPKKIGNYTDPADSGKDFLCSICYQVFDSGIYVTDVLYSQDNLEVNEPRIIQMFKENNTKTADVESNSFGRYFGQMLGKKTETRIVLYRQSSNKESRIFINAPQVQKKIYFPQDWASRWPLFWKHLTGFKQLFKANKHDDGPDALTGIIERNSSSNFVVNQYNPSELDKFGRGEFTGFETAPWNSDEINPSAIFNI